MNSRIGTILGLFIAFVSPLAAEQPPTVKIPKELISSWRLSSASSSEGPFLLTDPAPVLEFKGEQFLYGGEKFATVRVDPTTTPRVIDLRVGERNYEGIYELKQNELRICLHAQGDGAKERPDSFQVADHPSRRLLFLERIKLDGPATGGGFVGVMLMDDRERNRVVVTGTIDGGPAAKAGLRAGDVVRSIGGESPESLAAAVKAVRRAKPRSELKFVVSRNGVDQSITVNVGLMPLTALLGLD